MLRKYDSSYINLGFTWTGEQDDPRPANLRRHLETKHASFKDRPATVNVKALEASYRASCQIAKAGKPHIIGEELILPAAKELVSITCREKTANSQIVYLFQITVSRKIHDLAGNVNDILVKHVNSSRYFALHLDEATDFANLANLLVYIRYEWEGKVLEGILFCHSMPTRTTAEHIFQLLGEFVKKHGIDWQSCVRVCTDGAQAMTGRHSGIVVCIHKVAPNVKWVHCSIHQEALAVKKMPLLLHTEVWRLSRGKVLTCLFEPHSEIQLFLIHKLL
ncbi:ZBED5 protein, partial [Polyodon spathula]|nr:ZBED5 protein [Polyodon spathula]